VLPAGVLAGDLHTVRDDAIAALAGGLHDVADRDVLSRVDVARTARRSGRARSARGARRRSARGSWRRVYRGGRFGAVTPRPRSLYRPDRGAPRPHRPLPASGAEVAAARVVQRGSVVAGPQLGAREHGGRGTEPHGQAGERIAVAAHRHIERAGAVDPPQAVEAGPVELHEHRRPVGRVSGPRVELRVQSRLFARRQRRRGVEATPGGFVSGEFRLGWDRRQV
jgi:hypothetical protein